MSDHRPTNGPLSTLSGDFRPTRVTGRRDRHWRPTGRYRGGGGDGGGRVGSPPITPGHPRPRGAEDEPHSTEGGSLASSISSTQRGSGSVGAEGGNWRRGWRRRRWWRRRRRRRRWRRMAVASSRPHTSVPASAPDRYAPARGDLCLGSRLRWADRGEPGRGLPVRRGSSCSERHRSTDGVTAAGVTDRCDGPPPCDGPPADRWPVSGPRSLVPSGAADTVHSSRRRASTWQGPDSGRVAAPKADNARVFMRNDVIACRRKECESPNTFNCKALVDLFFRCPCCKSQVPNQ